MKEKDGIAGSAEFGLCFFAGSILPCYGGLLLGTQEEAFLKAMQ